MADRSLQGPPARHSQTLALAGWLPGLFWFAYALFNTAIDSPPAIGRLTAVNVLYVLMLPAAAVLAVRWRRSSVPGLTTYGAFMLFVLAGLLWRDGASDVDAPKQILIYGLFAFTAAQVVVSRRAIPILAGSMMLAAAMICGWTLWHAVHDGFALRGAVPANPNDVSAMIVPGMLAAIALYFDDARWRRASMALATLCWVTVLVLESRGVLLALVAAVGVIVWRMRPRAPTVRAALACALVGLVLSRVPYAATCALVPDQCFDQQQLAWIQHAGDRVRGLFAPNRAAPVASSPAAAAQVALALPPPGPPVVRDVGHGQYDDTLRYYRLEWLEMIGQTVVRASAPGPAVAFGPSGSGGAVRVERPPPPNRGETAWAYQSSADGRTWNDLEIFPIEQASADDTSAVSLYPGARQRALLIGRMDDTSTLFIRTRLWRGALAASTSSVRALVFGGGLGASHLAAGRADPRYLSLHSAPLQVLVDFGILGIGLFGIFNWQVLRALPARRGWVAALFFGGIIFWLVYGLTDTATDAHLYWVFLGAGAGAAAVSERSGPPPPARQSAARGA